MKMAIVTGAARGIGLATARLFVDQGYQVAMVDRDKDALDAAAASLASGTAFVCDVSDPAAVDEMVSSVLAASGRIDCLVNNAGVADFARLKTPALNVGALLWQPTLMAFIFVRGQFWPRLNKVVVALSILLQFPGCAHQHCVLPMASQRPE